MLKTCVDLFAGLGGNSEGARQAGLEVKVAANHWPVAVDIHRKNHPTTEHLLQDLQQANFYDWPDFDLLIASPACQGHSLARGKDRPHHDATRSTAWAVIACIEAKMPKAAVIENVPQYLDWKLYSQWASCLDTLGYHVSTQILNAADLGVPQERLRTFIVAVHKDLAKSPIAIPNGTEQHVPAARVIDESITKWSPIFKANRAQATIDRILEGRRRLGVDRFLIPYYGSGSGKTGRCLSRPLGTLTTKARWALVDQDRMRMLSVKECLVGQGFPGDYQLSGKQDLDHMLIGNSVPPAMTRHVIQQLDHALSC